MYPHRLSRFAAAVRPLLFAAALVAPVGLAAPSGPPPTVAAAPPPAASAESGYAIADALIARKPLGGATVIVERYHGGEVTEVFRYEERVLGETNGNAYMESPPNIALHRPTSRLATSDARGVHVVAPTGEVEDVLIAAGEVPSRNPYQPPLLRLISPQSGESIVTAGLFWPHWSSDGAFLALFDAAYESGRWLVIDVAAGSAGSGGLFRNQVDWNPIRSELAGDDTSWDTPGSQSALIRSSVVTDGRWSVTTSTLSAGKLKRLRWSPNGDSLGFEASHFRSEGTISREQWQFGVVDITTLAVTILDTTSPTEKWRFRFGGPPQFGADGHLVWCRHDGVGRVAVFEHDPADGSVRQIGLAEQADGCRVVSVLPDAALVLVRTADAADQAALLRFDRRDGSATRLLETGSFVTVLDVTLTPPQAPVDQPPDGGPLVQ